MNRRPDDDPAAVLDCDVLVVGGGINGCGIARDLAGRGWRVVLAEADDLGAHTSSASTKLIHGGLRYLEYYEFGLVRKALQERERLMRSAPHLIRPLRFVVPHDAAMRPAWMIRAGLFLYDHLAAREWLPDSCAVDLHASELGQALQPRYTQGFIYSDAWVDDARLVLACAQDARSRGAQVLPRTRCVGAERARNGWQARLQPRDGAALTCHARALVNAAGPWVEQFLRDAVRSEQGEALAGRHLRHLRLVRGSHIVVPRCFDHDHAYLFQNADHRIIFAIPYEGAYTLIGTTEVEQHGDPAQARADAAEIDYLCEQAGRYLRTQLTPADVVWHYSGVRPLLDDEAGSASAVTRDYLLDLHDDAAPLLSVWGGKITTFRKLAEEAADRLGDSLALRGVTASASGPIGGAWTEHAPFAGGDFSAWIGPAGEPTADVQRLADALRVRHPWLPETLVARWVRAYGAATPGVIGTAQSLADLGVEVAPGLHEAELRHLQREEWAREADDVLWRRSKLGLHCTSAQREAVAAWLAAHPPG